MKIYTKLVLLFIVLILNYSTLKCISSNEDENIGFKTIYVLKHRWHTGIIIKTDDVKKSMFAIANDFENTQYIEIGWGDKDFYMAEKETVCLVLKAVLLPTESVLHIAEINSHPLLSFKENEIIELKLSLDDFDKLVKYLNNSFYLNDDNSNIRLGRGLYGNSYFYLSNEKYHLFKTCNVWIAKGLINANVSIKPFFALTSKNVMKQLSKNK